MFAHRTETTLDEDGVVILKGLPFGRGEAVEVIVLPLSGAKAPQARYPLRGLPVTLDRPTEPAAAESWEAAG